MKWIWRMNDVLMFANALVALVSLNRGDYVSAAFNIVLVACLALLHVTREQSVWKRQS